MDWWLLETMLEEIEIAMLNNKKRNKNKLMLESILMLKRKENVHFCLFS